MVNFQPYEDQVNHPPSYDPDEVLEVVLPYLTEIRELGCRTFIDATPPILGRDPVLIRRLSEASGLHMLTPTGNYAAMENRFLPPYVFDDPVEALAERWIQEADEGIEETGIRPGFIKLGFNGGPLSPVEEKLIRAAAVAHLETGLTIGAHTGPAVSAFGQLERLEAGGVHPSAWIWIHAQSEPDPSRLLEAAGRGAWISCDGVKPDSVEAYVGLISRLRDGGFLHRVLVSHDAGWYTIGEEHGGDFRSYDTVFTALVPALDRAGFTQVEIDTLLVDNPARAFSISVRRS